MHACRVLAFEPDVSQDEISRQCAEWADDHCAHDGGENTTIDVNWTSEVYDSYEEAEEFLKTTFGNYKEVAVQYKVQVVEDSKAAQDLVRRIGEYEDRLEELNKPHYVGVKIQTVKCKTCGAVLPVKYCGDKFINNCVFCDSDLRPASTLDKVASYQNTLDDLKIRLEKEREKQKGKSDATVVTKLAWAVAAEVRC